jgi:hypothetical protein
MDLDPADGRPVEIVFDRASPPSSRTNGRGDLEEDL